MRTLFLLAMAVPAILSGADQFDDFGGATAKQCTTGPKPLFYVEEVDDRWWWCTPRGNVMWVASVWNVKPETTVTWPSRTKIGGSLSSSQSWQSFTTRRLAKWGFNTYDHFGNRNMFPSSNTNMVFGYQQSFPVISGEELKPVHYGGLNSGNLIAQPVKWLDTQMSWGAGYASRGASWRIHDFYDSGLKAYLKAILTGTGGSNAFYHAISSSNPDYRALLMAYSVDDTDWLFGAGAGIQFDTFQDGTLVSARKHGHYGLAILYAPALQGALARDPVYTSSSTYTNNQSGVLLQNPRTANITCNGAQEAGPKGDAAYAKETMLTYTMPADTVCAKYALAKFLERKHGTIATFNAQWGGTPYTTFYSSGVFVGDPAAGAKYVSSGFVASKVDVSDGVLVGTTDGSATFTGVIDSVDPSNRIGVSSLRVYLKNTGTGVSTFVGADERHMGSHVACWNTTGSTTTGHIWGQTLSGRLDLSCTNLVTNPASTIDYTNGQITLRFDTAPASGLEVRVDYIRNGWAWGTGILDEDGRGKAWLPNIDTVALAATGHPENNMNFLPSPSIVPTPQVKADLDEFFYRSYYRYFMDMRRGIDEVYAALPGNPTGCDPDLHQKGHCPVYTGSSYLSTWGTPAQWQTVKAAGDVLDVYPMGWTGSFDPVGPNPRVDYVYENLGNKPVFSWDSFDSGWDGPYPRRAGNLTGPKPDTQDERGERYKSQVRTMLDYQYPNGPGGARKTHPQIGMRWWDLKGSDGEGMNWGMITPNDDPLDGYCPGPGTRLEMIPGGAKMTSVVSPTGVTTTATFHNMSVGVRVRFAGCASGHEALCATEWPVTAIAAGNFTLALSGVSSATYNLTTDPNLKIAYAQYPCGGANYVCPTVSNAQGGACTYCNSGTNCTGGGPIQFSTRNGWSAADPRRLSDPDGPWNNSFGDFLGKVKEANYYWLDLLTRPKVTTAP